MTELCIEIKEKRNEDDIKCSEQILFLCPDGGGDHNVSKISVQISLLCLFLQLDSDYLIAMRTCLTQSWVNPAETVMYFKLRTTTLWLRTRENGRKL